MVSLADQLDVSTVWKGMREERGFVMFQITVWNLKQLYVLMHHVNAVLIRNLSYRVMEFNTKHYSVNGEWVYSHIFLQFIIRIVIE